MTSTDKTRARLREINILMAKLVAEQATLLSNLDTADEPFDPVEGPMIAMKRDPDMEARFEWARNPKMRLADIIELTGKTKRTIYRWMDEQNFPRPEIIKKAAYWPKRDVLEWWEANKENVGRWPVM